jgi:hypothetical protein
MAMTFSALPPGTVALAAVAFSEEQHIAAVCVSGVFVKRALVDEPFEKYAVKGEVCAACPTQARNSLLVVFTKHAGVGDTTVEEVHASGMFVRRAGCVPRVAMLCTNDRFVACITADNKVAVFSFRHFALLRSWDLAVDAIPRQCKLDDSDVLHVQLQDGEQMAFTLEGDSAPSPSHERFESSCLRTRTCDAFYEIKNDELAELQWF